MNIKRFVVALSIISLASFAADYRLTAKGGVDLNGSFMGGGELTYMALSEYLELGLFGEGYGTAGSVFGGIVGRIYVPFLGVFVDAKVGNGLGAGIGFRLNLPLEVRPFAAIAVPLTGTSSTHLGVMLSLPF